MKKLTNKKRFSLGSSKGFTLIEVVLVLAIGGLIFLLAFIAFQQVSANRRDTQRRADAGRVLAELQNYIGDTKNAIIITTSSNTNGSDVSGTGACTVGSANNISGFTTVYLCKDGKFYSPDGKNYNLEPYNATAPISKDSIRISQNLSAFGPFFAGTAYKACNGDNSKPGDIKVEIGLEKGVACRELN